VKLASRHGSCNSRSRGLIELNLEVVDSGPGLPKAAAAALTEIGMTDPSDLPRGLGVRVVRDLARGLGGRIVATAAVDGWIAYRCYFAAERRG
jgi:sensor histidine kinase regulating citrate/malate metabolism